MHQEPKVTATKTPNGWKIELDHAAWEHLLGAVTLAIESEMRNGKQPNVDLLRKLRAALRGAERDER